MALHPIRHRAHRRHSGQHQSGLSLVRARIRAQQSRLQSADHGAPAIAPATMSRCCAPWCRRSTAKQTSASGEAAAAQACRRARRWTASPRRPLILAIDVACRSGSSRPAGWTFRAHSIRTTPSISSSPAARPGRPKGRRSPISTSSTMRATRRRPWRSPPRIVCAFRCRSIIASAWCWACSPAQRSAPAWSSPARVSMLRRRSRRWRATNARLCTASRRCSSPSSSMPNFANYDTSTLRTGIMAGAPCPIDTMRAVIDRMHMREVTIGYGMTETSPLSFQSRTDDPLDRRVSTVGRILPHVEVKIVDANGKVAPLGESGELCTRGYGVMRGYWDDPRTQRGGDRRGGLDAFGRSRDHRRAWLLHHRRAAQGHAHPRRREYLSARDRGVFAAAPEGAIRAGLRRSRSSSGRRSLRLHRAQAQPVGDRGGNSSHSAAARFRITRCRATFASCRNFP